MKKHEISSLDKLCIKSKNNLEWFWESVDEDIGIVWDSPYEKILDVSKALHGQNGLLTVKQTSTNHL